MEPTIESSIHDLMYLLHDVRQMLSDECEHHEPEDCVPGRGYCPVTLHERMESLHDGTPVWRLIRAAPELLDACHLALDEIEQWAEVMGKEDPRTEAAIKALTDAIAKAA